MLILCLQSRPNPTQRHRRHPQIRRHQMQRHPVQNFRRVGCQLLVAFNRRILELVEENVAVGDEPFANEPCNGGFNRRIFLLNAVGVRPTEHQDLGVFETLNRKATGLSQVEAFKGSNQLILEEKLESYILARTNLF